MKDREQNREMEDLLVAEALQLFRESLHSWSEREFSKTRTIKRSRWDVIWRLIANPAMAWALTSALLITSVGVPVTVVRHDRQVSAERRAEWLRQRQLSQEAAERRAAAAMNDDELLEHVDSDIAQAAPDAMQPLASLMTDATTE